MGACPSLRLIHIHSRWRRRCPAGIRRRLVRVVTLLKWTWPSKSCPRGRWGGARGVGAYAALLHRSVVGVLCLTSCFHTATYLPATSSNVMAQGPPSHPIHRPSVAPVRRGWVPRARLRCADVYDVVLLSFSSPLPSFFLFSNFFNFLSLSLLSGLQAPGPLRLGRRPAVERPRVGQTPRHRRRRCRLGGVRGGAIPRARLRGPDLGRRRWGCPQPVTTAPPIFCGLCLCGRWV